MTQFDIIPPSRHCCAQTTTCPPKRSIVTTRLRVRRTSIGNACPKANWPCTGAVKEQSCSGTVYYGNIGVAAITHSEWISFRRYVSHRGPADRWFCRSGAPYFVPSSLEVVNHSLRPLTHVYSPALWPAKRLSVCACWVCGWRMRGPQISVERRARVWAGGLLRDRGEILSAAGHFTLLITYCR